MAETVSTNQFKNGNHIEVEGTIFKILEFQHVKPGKGGAFVRTKLRRTADGAVIDYTPLSDVQLISMVNELLVTTKADKEHLAEVFALVNGFSVKDEHQIFHPSTQLRPAVDPAKTHWREEVDTKPPRKAGVLPKARYVGCSQKLCRTGLECSDSGCDICIIYDQMATRFCRSGEF